MNQHLKFSFLENYQRRDIFKNVNIIYVLGANWITMAGGKLDHKCMTGASWITDLSKCLVFFNSKTYHILLLYNITSFTQKMQFYILKSIFDH